MHCASFGWNWPGGSGEEDSLNLVNVFSLFGNYLPLELGGALHLNKLESFTQGCFVPSLVDIGPVVLEKKMKIRKVYDNKDDDRHGTNCDQKCSLKSLNQWDESLKISPCHCIKSIIGHDEWYKPDCLSLDW